MVKEVIGTCTCPECGGAAEIKRSKSGLAYRWCLDCHAQYFPRNADASDRLIASLGKTPTPKPPPQSVKRATLADAISLLGG